MKVKMLVDAPGSPDGVTVNQYAADAIYDVPADLAETFVAQGLAEVVEVAAVKRAAGPAENKGA